MEIEKSKEVILKAVVSDMMANKVSFTSVCVANRVKTLGTWISNSVVAEYLRKNAAMNALEMGLHYSQKQIWVASNAGPKMTATLHYSYMSDPDDFTARDKKAITPAQFEEMHGVTVHGKEIPATVTKYTGRHPHRVAISSAEAEDYLSYAIGGSRSFFYEEDDTLKKSTKKKVDTPKVSKYNDYM